MPTSRTMQNHQQSELEIPVLIKDTSMKKTTHFKPRPLIVTQKRINDNSSTRTPENHQKQHFFQEIYILSNLNESYFDDIFSEAGVNQNAHGISIPDSKSPDIQDNIPVTMPVPVITS